MRERWEEFYDLMTHVFGTLVFMDGDGGTGMEQALLEAWLAQNELGRNEVKQWFGTGKPPE